MPHFADSLLVLCLLLSCTYAVIAVEDVRVDVEGSTSNTHSDQLELQRRLVSVLAQLDKKSQELKRAVAATQSAEKQLDVISTHFEGRLATLKAELEGSKRKVDEMTADNGQLKERMARLEQEAASSECQTPPACNCSRAADPSAASNADLKDEVEKLIEDEKARQREIQHDSADSADNGPKEISIHCPSNLGVTIVDLDEAQRDNNECLVLNINGQEMNSRLVLFCDGTTLKDTEHGF